MKKEYDFSQGTRGKFYFAKEKMNVPVYLDKNIEEFYTTKAEMHGQSLTDLINKVLKKEMEIAKELE